MTTNRSGNWIEWMRRAAMVTGDPASNARLIMLVTQSDDDGATTATHVDGPRGAEIRDGALGSAVGHRVAPSEVVDRRQLGSAIAEPEGWVHAFGRSAEMPVLTPVPASTVG